MRIVTSDHAPLPDRTLLLVDDDRLVLVVMAQGLRDAGYRVDTAESVDEAEALLSGGLRPDLAILDVRMPRRDGLELAARLQSLDHVPFILLTACSDPQIVEQAAARGALGYLVKPVEASHLIPAVEAALARAVELDGLKRSTRQLQTALDIERNISVAIGMTMMQLQLERRPAFELLRRIARSQRRKLAEIAAEVIAARGVPGAPQKPLDG